MDPTKDCCDGAPAKEPREDRFDGAPTAVVPRVLRPQDSSTFRSAAPRGQEVPETHYGNQHPSLGVFGWHRPTPKQAADMETLRARFALLADAISHAAPESPDRTTALRCLREAMMWANAAIVTGGAGLR